MSASSCAHNFVDRKHQHNEKVFSVSGLLRQNVRRLRCVVPWFATSVDRKVFPLNFDSRTTCTCSDGIKRTSQGKPWQHIHFCWTIYCLANLIRAMQTNIFHHSNEPLCNADWSNDRALQVRDMEIVFYFSPFLCWMRRKNCCRFLLNGVRLHFWWGKIEALKKVGPNNLMWTYFRPMFHAVGIWANIGRKKWMPERTRTMASATESNPYVKCKQEAFKTSKYV